jgi:hypothetical protein
MNRGHRKSFLCAVASAALFSSCRSSDSTEHGSSSTTADGGSSAAQEPWTTPPLVEVPPLPAPRNDWRDHPRDERGRPIIAQSPFIDLVVNDRRDALSARETCADLISHCFDPQSRSVDSCMRSAPRCKTSEPWMEPSACCAEACWTTYAELRQSNVDPLTAYLRVLYEAPACMPGVDAAMAGAP